MGLNSTDRTAPVAPNSMVRGRLHRRTVPSLLPLANVSSSGLNAIERTAVGPLRPGEARWLGVRWIGDVPIAGSCRRWRRWPG